VSQRVALEAMITHSDNTATDIALKHVGPDRVRRFIADAGLNATQIPESTGQLVAYLLDFPDWQEAGWSEITSDADYPSRPVINPSASSVSSPNDLVEYYARAIKQMFTRIQVAFSSS
jgi:beta-lactamase class A